MASRAARPRLLACLVAVAALIFACRTLAPTFAGAPSVIVNREQTALRATKQDSRRGALFGLLGSAAAATSMQPAEAAGGYGEPPKVSVFGFNINMDGPTSDAYNFVDKDAYSPYSEFSGSPDDAANIYKPYNDKANQKLKVELEESWRRYETDVKKELDRQIPNRVRMEITRQVGVMRKNMLHFSDQPPRDLSRTKLAREFFEDISGLLTFADRSKWDDANKFYAKSLESLQRWKEATPL